MRILQNALNNAADACRTVKLPHVEVSLKQDTRQAIISICDNGCGIPPEHLERVFTPFYTTKTKGSGLGLAIIKKLTAAMNGEVQITSQVNAGTTLRLIFPLVVGSE